MTVYLIHHVTYLSLAATAHDTLAVAGCGDRRHALLVRVVDCVQGAAGLWLERSDLAVVPG